MRCTDAPDRPAARRALDLGRGRRGLDGAAAALRRRRAAAAGDVLGAAGGVPAAGPDELAEQSLYAVMRGRYGIDPVSAETSLEPAALDAGDARHLEARPGAPAILVVAHHPSTARRPRPSSSPRDLYRGDRARFRPDRCGRSGE